MMSITVTYPWLREERFAGFELFTLLPSNAAKHPNRAKRYRTMTIYVMNLPEDVYPPCQSIQFWESPPYPTLAACSYSWVFLQS